MSETKLKPCAHCGDRVDQICPQYHYGDIKFWVVICSNKNCKWLHKYEGTKAEAIAAWNRRDTETELIQALKELVHEQCQLTCKDHDKECTPTCWVLKHKQLIASLGIDKDAVGG